MKILPIHLSDDPDALDTVSGALTAPLDSAWLSVFAFLGNSAPAPAPASASGGEGLPGAGSLGDQGSDASLGETAPAESGGVVALADAFFFVDSPGLPAGSDAAAMASSFIFAPAAEAPADSGSLATGTDALLGDEAATAPVGSGGVVLPAPNIETSAAAPADAPTGVRSIEISAVAPVDIPTVGANFHVSPQGLSIGNAGSGANSSLGPHQDVGVIPGLEFVGPDGPEPVVGPLQTVASSHSSPVESSMGVAAAGAGMTISQVATNANGSISETVTFAGSGIVFHDTFDAGVSQAYQNCALSAEQAIASQWSNSVTINEEFSAQAQGQNGDLASNEFFIDNVSYAALKSALTTLASQEPGDSYLQQAVAHLPSTDPSGGAGFDLALPYARMLGLTSTTESPDDIVTLNTSYNWSYGQDVINTIEHEISEGGMGRIGGLGDQNSFWSVMDLFRYNSSGAPDYTDGRDGRTTFFSYNGGATLSSLSFNNEFNSSGQQVNGGDTADFVQQDVFGTGAPGETNTLSQTDIQIMDTLGWDPQPLPVSASGLNFVATADFNNDGMSDVLWDSTNGTPTIWLMNGTTLSSASSLPDIGNSWQIVDTGHFDGAGTDADILLENSAGTPVIWIMNGTTISSGAALPTVGTAWHVLGTADFNGDHDSDILWESTSGTPAIWLMNGTNIVSGAALPNLGSAWQFLATADFNGNGNSDILWESTSGTPAIWMMNGTNIVSGAALPNLGSAWHFLATADFSGNGNSDILWESTTGTPAIWMMNGTSIVSGAALPNLGNAWHFVGTADFNGDGAADILWLSTSGTPAIWLMNGATISSGAALPNPGAGWHILGFGDFNDDGKADILWENSSTSATVIWLMNGTQVQSGEFISANGTEAMSAAQVLAQMSVISELATQQGTGGNSPASSVAATTAEPAAGDAASSAASYAQTAWGQPPAGSATIPVAAGQTVSGDAGNDTFIFNTKFGNATINNFAPASDTIEINRSLFANVGDLMEHATQIGADTVIADGAHDTLTLHNLLLNQLHHSNFIIT
jgi:hypothetical protein